MATETSAAKHAPREWRPSRSGTWRRCTMRKHPVSRWFHDPKEEALTEVAHCFDRACELKALCSAAWRARSAGPEVEAAYESIDEGRYAAALRLIEGHDVDLLPHEAQLERAFTELAEQWRAETETTSSVEEMVLHPAYQRIIGMGPLVVPFLLRELAERPHHWFWALRAITGTDPIREEQRGNVREMVAAWLNWARQENLHW